MKTKSITTIAAIILPIVGFAQTPPAPPPPPGPHGPPGVPGHHEKAPKVPTTFLGVETSQVPDVVSEQLGLVKGLGLVVEYVVPDSPAASAGIQQNDILKMLTILRKGQEQKITVKLTKKEVPRHHAMMPGMPGGDHDWDFDETGDLNEQMKEMKQQLKEQLREQLGAQRDIVRGAVMQAHEAAKRAREDVRRAAREIRILSNDDGTLKATKIDIGQAQIVFSDDKGENEDRHWPSANRL